MRRQAKRKKRKKGRGKVSASEGFFRNREGKAVPLSPAMVEGGGKGRGRRG